jgi:hypothetical protein
MDVLRCIAAELHGPGRALLKLTLENILPHRMEDPAYISLLRGERAGSTLNKRSSPVASAGSPFRDSDRGLYVPSDSNEELLRSTRSSPARVAVRMLPPEAPTPYTDVPRASRTPQKASAEFEAFLRALRLEAYVAPLLELGVESVSDLAECTAEDLLGLGMRELQRRRLMDGLAVWKVSPGRVTRMQQHHEQQPSNEEDTLESASMASLSRSAAEQHSQEAQASSFRDAQSVPRVPQAFSADEDALVWDVRDVADAPA